MDIAVVVPSRDRPVRLRWLLNALHDQTLEPERWEVVVAHDSLDAETDELLSSHPLTARVRVTPLRLPRGSSAAAKRNAAWRAASSKFLLFTHDDCRPRPDWLERTLEAVADSSGIVAGPVRPDPDEASLLQLSSSALTKDCAPLDESAHACNVCYPRLVVQAAGGFPESLSFLDELVLRQRAIQAGVGVDESPGMVTYHSVALRSPAIVLWRAWRRAERAQAVATEPGLRISMPYRGAITEDHLRLVLAIFGLVAGRRSALAFGLCLPWARANWTPHSQSWRGVVRSATDLPLVAAVQLVETGALAVSSLASRTMAL